MRIRSWAAVVLRAFWEHSNVFLSDLDRYGDITSTNVNRKTHETFTFIRSAGELLIDFGVCTRVFFCAPFMLISSAHVWTSADRATGAQWEHALAGWRGESEQEVRRVPSIATWMERRAPRCEASGDEARRCGAPRALYVPDDAQLMSYLGRSTLGSVCKGERSVRVRRHNHSNHRTGEKNWDLNGDKGDAAM